MSDDSPIQFRKRSDLVVVPSSGTLAGWTVKDPLTLQYFQLQAEEYSILEWLDGKVTLSGLVTRLGERFPSSQISAENVSQFVTSLLRSGLLAATNVGFGKRLADQNDHATRTGRLRKLGSLLSIRFRGVDPDRFLEAIQPATRLLLSKASLLAIGSLIAAAMLFAFGNIEAIVRRMPDLAYLVNARNLPLILLTFVLIKVFHELGHAVVCKHFGGECHEIGVILVALMPLLYCSVTDSWMQTRKWPRIAVSLAGVLVELTLAAGCLFLWLGSSHGPEGTFFLNVMLVCSVDTVLFNVNLLLRYDGYYVLSDLVGIPNLATEAKLVVWGVFDAIVLGVDSAPGGHTCLLYTSPSPRD